MKYIFWFVLILSFNQEDNFRKKHFLIENRQALSGYDPVSFFAKKPIKGTIPFHHLGLKYVFASQANLEKFKAKPSAYEPAYGG